MSKSAFSLEGQAEAIAVQFAYILSGSSVYRLADLIEQALKEIKEQSQQEERARLLKILSTKRLPTPLPPEGKRWDLVLWKDCLESLKPTIEEEKK